ncbi:MAG: threonine/serine exporter family protein [Clostridiales bacterium]|nr:threonine/serine exporter family protein [Clostridiales bacterium]
MEQYTEHEILNISARAGEVLLKATAETYRVEETCRIVCQKSGLEHAEAFVLPAVIILTSNSDGEETKIRKTYDRSTNITNICRVNSFSRNLENDSRSYTEKMEYLKELRDKKPYPDRLYCLMCGFVSGGFSLLAGATVYDFCAAFVCGLLSGIAAILVKNLPAKTFLKCFLVGGITGAIAITASELSEKCFFEPIIVGGMKPFFPGITILLSLRDYLAGNISAGTSRLAEGLIVGGSLAAGVAIVLEMYVLLGGLL